MNESKAPFKTLGAHLKYLREQLKESLAEVSGAVEIDEGQLSRIEAGIERPAEEILLLLISHFDMADQEAVQLWELAGYDGEVPEQLRPEGAQPTGKSIVMLLALDTRTIYTDGVVIDATPAGITMNFTQVSGQSDTMPVARVGMSYEQAQEVLRALYSSLEKSAYLRQPKQLPPASDCPHADHQHDV
ncbi:MAG TPA: helix-turn-helix transcriptional regulator [Candidatus Saccharimonadales bacterium]|nr:helix-turn-helix transcriptional regulator [Candidatus Saccharimonadales bacterium]